VWWGAIAIQTEGGCSSGCKILVGGTVVTSLSVNNGNGSGFALVRYSGTGSVQNHFRRSRSRGYQPHSTEPDATPFALAIQSNGDIIAAGTACQPGGNPAFVTQADFAMAWYSSNGGLVRPIRCQALRAGTSYCVRAPIREGFVDCTSKTTNWLWRRA
jgi:hypothetical protein